MTNPILAPTSTTVHADDAYSLLPFLLSLFGGSAARAPERAAARPYDLVEHAGATREVPERFIAQCFRDSFGARIDAFMPRLLTLRDCEGATRGALGLRAASSRLFVEHYLDAPVERAIASVFGTEVERRSIVEVGHFSGAFAGAMRTMIVLLIERLHREGCEWVVFAGTRALRNAFVRMGLFPVELCVADAARLPAESRTVWGRYYDHAPRVYAGRVAQGWQALGRETTA